MKIYTLSVISLNEVSEEIGIEYPWEYLFAETAEDNSYVILSLEDDRIDDLEYWIEEMETNGHTKCFDYKSAVNELKLIKHLRNNYHINKDSILCYISY